MSDADDGGGDDATHNVRYGKNTFKQRCGTKDAIDLYCVNLFFAKYAEEHLDEFDSAHLLPQPPQQRRSWRHVQHCRNI